MCADKAPANGIAKTFIDEAELRKIYHRLKKAAEEMDCDAVDKVIIELDTYDITDDEIDRINILKNKADNFDYDGILEALDTM